MTQEENNAKWLPLRDARRSAVQRVYGIKDAAADQLIVAAERIRSEAFRSGDETAIQQAQQVSRSLERAAVYLHGHTLDQITDDATLMVQSKPWQAVVIAFLVGAIFGRRLRRRM
ncbi:MAG: hypothetical protein EHM39_02715 [Chloroflexi bacterium]|nr:MAG: hypothetical protein EHM39_02715 [Chloroflexota bacterium]